MKRLQRVLSRGSYNPLPLLKVIIPSCQLDGEVLPSPDVNGSRTSKSGQALTQSSRYPSSDYLLLIDEGEPQNFKELTLIQVILGLVASMNLKLE